MSRHPLKLRQARGQRSPWTLAERLRVLVWEMAWLALGRWTPKPANGWRILLLRIFGARIEGKPFVHQRARIQMPWNIELHDAACVGDRANLYSLDRISLGAGALIAQEAYLCTGTHDLTDPEWPLLTAPITVGERAFVGARAFVLPGVTIGAHAVVGAASVVTKNVEAGGCVRGNPARPAETPGSWSRYRDSSQG